MELSSAPRPPDLSLHISPPSSSSSGTKTTTTTSPISSTDAMPFDVWRQTTSRSSPAAPHHPHTYTDLSLTHPAAAAAAMDVDTPWKSSSSRLGDHDEARLPIYSFRRHHNLHGYHRPLLEVPVNDLSPIKGIPVYHNRSFPFIGLDHLREKDPSNPKMGFYQAPFPPSWSSFLTSSSCSSSTSSSPSLMGGCLDVPMGLLHSVGAAPPATYRVARIGGWAADCSPLKSQQQPQAQFGIGGLDGMMMRSRFLPKLPTKRSMRAPRMRWTTTLHARFVHAVELLGGHESI